MTVDLSTIETITRLAEQFGPFLFAILFILVVTRTARSYYRECATRKDPPPTQQELKTYRTYFLSSVWVGIAVMCLSIGWWIYAQSRGFYVYQVAIVDLQDDETILADYYLKRVDRPAVPGVTPAHDRYFLIVRNEPFKIGERFTFEYFKMPSDSTAFGTGIASMRVQVKYSGVSQESYRLDGSQLVIAQHHATPAQVFAPDEVDAAAARYALASMGPGRTRLP